MRIDVTRWLAVLAILAAVMAIAIGWTIFVIGAVLNVQADHLGMKGVETLEQLAEVKRVVVEVAKHCAVLNADDPLVLKMSAHTDAENICYVTMNPQHALVREHIRAGGRACALEAGINGQMITLYDRGGHIPLLWTHLIPATLEGRATHNVQNAMFAASIAFSLGVKLDAIRQGLRTFDTTFFQAPGRMNIFDGHPFKVILDYGHNAAAVASAPPLLWPTTATSSCSATSLKPSLRAISSCSFSISAEWNSTTSPDFTLIR